MCQKWGIVRAAAFALLSPSAAVRLKPPNSRMESCQERKHPARIMLAAGPRTPGSRSVCQAFSFFEMEVNMRRWNITVAGVALVVGSIAATASAQSNRGRYEEQQAQRGQYRQGGQSNNRQASRLRSNRDSDQRYSVQRAPGQAQGEELTDHQIANWLLVDNRAEIQLARLAQENASSDEVKKLAKHLIEEHAQTVEDLQEFAGQGRGSRQQTQGLNLVRLKQQLGQQCVASAEEELNQKDGAEFDKCFVGMQIAMHMQMLDTLKVFSRYASEELDEIIEEAEQTNEEHLERAKKLIKQLDDDHDSATTGKRNGSHRERS